MAKSSLIKLDAKPGNLYTFKKNKRTGKKYDLEIGKAQTRKKPKENDEPQMGLVQGKMPDSVEEWRTALALDRLKIPYIFQYSVRGGKARRGGIVIDFLVLSPPLPIPVFVQGKYWHEKVRNKMLERTLFDRMMHENRGQFSMPLLVPAEKLTDINAAYQYYSKELRHGK